MKSTEESDVTIDGKPRRVHWRDAQTLILDDEPCDIAMVITENGVMSFSVTRRPLGQSFSKWTIGADAVTRFFKATTR